VESISATTAEEVKVATNILHPVAATLRLQ
jgi:hypothetical protein